MFATNVLGVLVGTLLFVTLLPEDVAAYSKYGRTCRDIGCPSDELCVMAEDPCTLYSQDKCGRYPTCRKANAGEASCASIVCNMNEYCKTENGVPKCVAKSPGVATRRPDHYPAPRPIPPTPPPRSTSYGGHRNTGYSGSRNTVGNGSIWNRLFGNDRGSRGRSAPRATNNREEHGYYDTHVSTDSRGNRVWTFSG